MKASCSLWKNTPYKQSNKKTNPQTTDFSSKLKYMKTKKKKNYISLVMLSKLLLVTFEPTVLLPNNMNSCHMVKMSQLFCGAFWCIFLMSHRSTTRKTSPIEDWEYPALGEHSPVYDCNHNYDYTLVLYIMILLIIYL